MRNVIIKRIKSFAGCAVKLKVYIEDPNSIELTINNIQCRKLGELKNGEEKTFQVGEQSAKIFVIADTLSKDYCNDYYQLPEGQEDIYLSGKAKFNPAAGNAFRFDNNDSKEVLAVRKKGSRKGLLILIAAAVVGFFVGFSISGKVFSPKPVEKTFSTGGMIITLTDEFVELEQKGDYSAVFDSENIAVFALQEKFSMYPGSESYTAEEYVDLVKQANQRESETVHKDGDLVWFEYEFIHPENNELIRYYTFGFKASSSFWLVQFAVLGEETDAYEDQILEWARSIEFFN